MTISKTTIVVIIMIGIIHHKEIILIENHIEEVIIKKIESLITFNDKMIITKVIDSSMIIRSRRGLDNFNMTLNKEKILSQTMTCVRNMKQVRQVAHRYRIATYVPEIQ